MLSTLCLLLSSQHPHINLLRLGHLALVKVGKSQVIDPVPQRRCVIGTSCLLLRCRYFDADLGHSLESGDLSYFVPLVIAVQIHN